MSLAQLNELLHSPHPLARAVAQVWANCGAIVAMAAGATGATAVTWTWLVGVAGLVVFHVSRVAVVLLERASRFKRLEDRLAELIAELATERAEHERDRERWFALIEKLVLAQGAVAEAVIEAVPATPEEPLPNIPMTGA